MLKLKKAENQLRLKVEEAIKKLESTTGSECSDETQPDTYSNLSTDDRDKLLEGLKTILNEPSVIETNHDIIPIHLVMIYPQLREIQMLINKIVNEE